ncbi:tetraspanin-19 [Malaclemys terrapin pileata]|uniref:tetraspanin-19 n=1 Tax=Malaclemys terrapin pileata TaxID=2991368 RepID=UPI0023A8F7CC|nr:tetraspanin-19 [Malaclemys terrapin pileata]
MEPRDKILILKYFLSIFNGIFLVLGLMLMMFGMWLLIDRNNLFTVLSFTGENHLVAYISYMLLGIGSIIVFISFLGFLGSFEEIRWLLILYLGLIVLLFGIQVAMPVLIYIRKEEVQIMWNDRIDAVISNYGNKNLTGREHEWDILNAVQHTLECCGRHNSTDWKKNENKQYTNQVPCSCTKSNRKEWFCDATANEVYTKGCDEYIKMWFENNALVLISINIALLIVEVLLFTLAVLLFKNTKKNKISLKE